MRIFALLLIAGSTSLSHAEDELRFEYTIYIAKSAKEVWNSITQKDVIDRYYMAPVHTLDPREGGRISYGGDSEMIFGKITEIREPSVLAHSFRFAGSEGEATAVKYEITAIGESMCALMISHSGFEKKDQDFADITGGWPVIASSLKTLLETGKGMPWPKPKAEQDMPAKSDRSGG